MMAEQSPHKFDETLISGYLDGELTQGDAQRVRLHLEDCETCRRLAGELGQLREVTMSTEFKVPDDSQWDETPSGGLSAVFRNFGWMILLAWFAGITGFALWQVATESENLWETLIGFSMFLGFGLVFLSVLLDRLKARKTDRYLGVKK
jgi:anti-sigma factor RsiW